MNALSSRRWSPYAAGAGIGILSWFAFWALDHPLGVSTGVVRVVGLLEGPHASGVPYLAKLAPFFNFEVMLILGLLLGAFASSRLSGDRARPGASRTVPALLGGFLLMFGARLANGCTSGHGISGSLQLAASGWLFFVSIFASGMLTAFLLYRKEA
jgi:uncharacterized membrane protein YedE/YeeE